ncbi:MAG: ATP-binding cassette domain-containing protein [Prevotella sp.]|nr:ATP-binding cassette domain-containing protein [Prevotella sp.]
MDTAKAQQDRQGHLTVIAGLNASGKTQLAQQLQRQMDGTQVRYVAFCDTYGTATDRSYYLQQRWNQHDIEQETPTVAATLERAFTLSGADTPERRRHQAYLYQLMNIEHLLGEYIISLSSGELRKVHLLKTLLANPQTLILDNPFIGLDAPMRSLLAEQLHALRQQGLNIYLLIARPNETPEFADEVINTEPNTHPSRPTTSRPTPCPSLVGRGVVSSANKSIYSPPYKGGAGGGSAGGGFVVQLRDVSIRYGERTILDRLSWTVREGEHWALSGPNGSGKSTLLSLICADNPQAYACDIALFGHQRGTGETIWEIKRRIGYVSPELHRAYLRPLPALHVVASGLKDTVGLYARASQSELQQCREWMRVFQIDHLADRPFTQISSGEQRMVLVCRAFVKTPQLLILDEPMHGLDQQRQQLVKEIIDRYCADPTKTLIFVTHYEEELPTCIDHHLQLNKTC